MQKIIHLIDVVGASRFLRYVLVFLCVTLLALIYDLNGYKNQTTQEGMDAAQLARNLATGKGYTTQFIRPFSLFLLQRTAGQTTGSTTNQNAGAALLHAPVPDISNPPLYPLALAGLMKVVPFHFDVELKKPFWSVVDAADASGGRMFWRHQPDFVIAVFNQALLVLVVLLAFWWARRLFDAAVAWTAAFLLFGTELLWKFSVSGLPTMLLLLIFMCLVWCLTWLESELEEPRWGRAGLLLLGAAVGLLLGLGGLTSYAFALLIVPVLIWLAIYARGQAVPVGLVAVTGLLLVLGPWLIRNYNLSGVPFGTASYKILEGTAVFPGHRLERSLNPTVQVYPALLWQKLFVNAREVVEKNLFELGGSVWLTVFFVSGLMVGFRKPSLRRLRHFLLLSFGVLLAAQALGRTQLTADSPGINSENLLVLLLPLVVIFGVAMFFVLLDQIQFPAAELRIYSQGLLGVLVVLPLFSSLLFGRTSPVVYPPYHPPVIQQAAAWMHEDEWLMSDIPWAVAWYGNRPCAWLSLSAVPRAGVANAREDFISFNERKPIHALYLTPLTVDGRFLTDWVRPAENSWGAFITQCLILKEVPDSFPLHEMPTGFLPEQLFLADAKRWQTRAAEKPAGKLGE